MLRPQIRMMRPSPAKPKIHHIMLGGDPPHGNPGGTTEEECLTVEMVSVELAGDDPSGVEDEGLNVHVAALGILEGVTRTVNEAESPETIVFRAGEPESA